MKYYISTRGQDIDPCNAEELLDNRPYFSHKLIPFLMQNDFENNRNRYYVILADSGMGKTTFIYNLFFAYYKKLFRKYEIKFVPLSSFTVFKDIEDIENKQNTILLLDGLDENGNAIKNYEAFMKKIIDVTFRFHTIIITCRTQFFANEKEEPGYINAFSGNTNNKKMKFEKIYISPFNNGEINRYLKKKYKYFWNNDKIKRAKKIIENCPKLMVRPMLLTYMDDLLEDINLEHNYVYEIYRELVSKWIEREENKLLYIFSEKVAEKMYFNETIYITSDEINELCKECAIGNTNKEGELRSLLNRNTNGAYKFSHKSIMEYFLATKAYRESEFRKIIFKTGFDGYDMFRFFLTEMDTSNFQETMNTFSDSNSYYFGYLQLSKANISEMKLENGKFEKCNLFEADLSKSDFKYTSFIDMDMRKANINDSLFMNISMNDVDLENSSLKGVIFQDVEMKNVNFRNSNLAEANFKDTIFKNVTFINANLAGANLCNTDLRETDLTGANLSRANLKHSYLKHIDVLNVNLKEAELEGINLANLNLENIDLQGVNLKEACLFGAKLSNVNLKNADLRYAILRGADLREVNFSNADLRFSDLKYTKLVDVNFDSDTRLEYANLFCAIFSEEQIEFLEKKYRMNGVNVYIKETKKIVWYESYRNDRVLSKWGLFKRDDK